MKQSKKLSKKERNNNYMTYILNIIIKEKLEMEDEYHFLNIPCLPGKKMFVTRLFGKRI